MFPIAGTQTPTVPAFPQALAAHAADLKVSDFDVAPGADFIGQSNSIHGVALEIAHQAALRADEVVMDGDVPVKAQAVGGHLHARDQPLVLQAIENAVHRIQRDFGDTFSHLPKDGIRVGMLVRTGHRPEDLSALRSDSQPPTAAHLPEQLKALVEFSPAGFHCVPPQVQVNPIKKL
jgi:hypothetical protein